MSNLTPDTRLMSMAWPPSTRLVCVRLDAVLQTVSRPRQQVGIPARTAHPLLSSHLCLALYPVQSNAVTRCHWYNLSRLASSASTTTRRP